LQFYHTQYHDHYLNAHIVRANKGQFVMVLKRTFERTVSAISLMSKAKRGFDLIGKEKETGPSINEQCQKRVELGFPIETLLTNAAYCDDSIEQEKAIVGQFHRTNLRKANAAARRVSELGKFRDQALALVAVFQSQMDMIRDDAMNAEYERQFQELLDHYNRLEAERDLTPEEEAEINAQIEADFPRILADGEREAADPNARLAYIPAEEEPEATPIGTQYDDAEIKEELANILARGEPRAAYPNDILEELLRAFE
jgi:hypothetical protein